MLEKNRHVQASILDRLLDDEPGNSRESVRYRAADFRLVMASVSRDLENLLNTRRHILVPPAVYTELNNSLFCYGLPDFTSKNPATVSAGSQLRLEIEKTIARFEPRLKNVSVQMDSSARTGRHLNFRILAVLVVDPLTEPVTFETSFDANRSQYLIKS